MLGFVPHYVRWHYTHGFQTFFRIWGNFIWGVEHFFGIGNLGRSLFAPWKRMTESSHGAWNFEAVAGALVVNLVSRLLGLVIRLLLIFIGAIFVLLTITFGVAALVTWLFAPIVVTAGLGYGIYFMIP